MMINRRQPRGSLTVRGGGFMIVPERMRVQGWRMVEVVEVVEVVLVEEEEVVKRLLFGPGLMLAALR
jgi:hypothetical protein